MPRKKDISPSKDSNDGAEFADEKADKPKIKRKRLEGFQVTQLEAHFQKDIYPTTQMKEDIAKQLNLDPQVVSKWFINRRVKLRNEEKEDEGSSKTEAKEKKEVVGSAHTSNGGATTANGTGSNNGTLKITLRPKNEEATKDESTKIGSEVKQQSPPLKAKDNGSMTLTLGPGITQITITPGPGKATPPIRKRKEKKESLPQPAPPPKKQKKEKQQLILYTAEEEEEFWTKYKKDNNILDEDEEVDADESVPAEDQKEANGELHENGVNETLEDLEREYKRPPKVPLWKQLYLRYKSKLDKPNPELLTEQLNYIYNSRKEQGLHPFFAMITGPTIRPYRMEEFELILGRNTAKHRESDLHIGDNPRISHIHAKIEYDKKDSCYYLINLSKNGVKIKEGDIWVHYWAMYDRIPLPTPTTINIEGIPVYFQIFYIAPPPSEEDYDVEEPTYIPTKEPKEHKEKEPKEPTVRIRKAPVKGAKSYAAMIEEALREYDGQATYKEITDYIASRCQEDIVERKTWRNSVGGVLSSNALFEAAPLSAEMKDPKRGRGGFWRLKDYVPKGKSVPVHTTPSAEPPSTVNITIAPRTKTDHKKSKSNSTIVEPPAAYPLAFDLKTDEEIDIGEEADLPVLPPSSLIKDDLEIDEDDDSADASFFDFAHTGV